MYSTAQAAEALGVPVKRLDNFLVRHCRNSVPANAQGRVRDLSEQVVTLLAVALLLQRDLTMPLGYAWGVAQRLDAADDHQVPVGTLGSLSFDLPRLRTVVRQALADSVADRLPPRRGRPPKVKRKRGASW